LVSLVPVARVGDILLLKTSLPRPGRTTGAPTGTNLLQYNGTAPQHATQARQVSRQRPVWSHPRICAPALPQTTGDSSGGSTLRTGLGAAGATARGIFQQVRGAASGIQEGHRSRYMQMVGRAWQTHPECRTIEPYDARKPKRGAEVAHLTKNTGSGSARRARLRAALVKQAGRVLTCARPFLSLKR
jgi:hypothetical protein